MDENLVKMEYGDVVQLEEVVLAEVRLDSVGAIVSDSSGQTGSS